MRNFKYYLWLSQANLFGWLLLCSFIASSVVFKNGGVSNYGNHYSTAFFYTLAFVGNIIFIYMAAEALIMLDRKFKYLERYLSGLCAITLMVFISTFPRRFGMIFSEIHDNISIFLFAYELLLAIWLLIKRPTIETIFYLFIMIAGSTVALLSAVHSLHQMFVGQMFGALGFSLLMVLVLPKVVESKLKS